MRINLYWVQGPWPGRLAIMPRPRGGDWLEDEVTSWRLAGVEVVVSLLTREEVIDLDLTAEADLCRAQGIEVLAFSIPDRTAPSLEQATKQLLATITEHLAKGRTVAVHCRQGIGRAGLIAAALLVASGMDPESAINRVSAARGVSIPETTEQRNWIVDFARATRPIVWDQDRNIVQG